MGFRFRRSFKIIPGVRLNLSGGGASVSLGGRGFHYNIGPHGTRTTVGLPGSGMSWSGYQSYSSTADSPPLPDANDPTTYERTVPDQGATVIDSAPIDQLIANSTADLAGTLAASRSRWRSYKAVIATLAALFVVGAVAVIGLASPIPPLGAFIITTGAVIILGSLVVHGRETSTVSLDYELSPDQSQRFETLTRAFNDLSRCNRIWNIPLERQQTDWKRNAGASKTIQRNQIHPAKANPPLVTTSMDFLKLPLGKETLYLTPDAILVAAGSAVAGFSYNDVEVTCRPAPLY